MADPSYKFRPAGPGPRGPRGMQGGEKPANFKSAILRCLKYLGRSKLLLLVAVLLCCASTVFNVIGPKLLGNATTLIAEGIVAKHASTGFIDFPSLAAILIGVLILYLISAAFNLAQGQVMAGLIQKLNFRLRKDISQKINRLPFSYFDSHATGDTLSCITNDVDTLGSNLNQCVSSLVSCLVTLCGSIAVMLSISWAMTLIALLVIPVSALLLSFMVKRSQKYFKANQDNLALVNSQVEEVFSGRSVIKAFNREGAAEEAFYRDSNTLYGSYWKSHFLSGLMGPLMRFVANIGYVLVVVAGAYFSIKGVIRIGDIQAFIQYVKNLSQPISEIGQSMNSLQSAAAAAERIFAFLDADEIQESCDAAASIDCIRSIEFQHVAFSYDADKPLIKDLNFRVEKGQTVALVGPTGAGKSSIVKLLMRFYDVDAGRILINGQDIRSYARSEIRSHMSMVLQDSCLFEGSIADNIRFGNPNADDEQVHEAARNALAEHFIQTLPDSYEMKIAQDAENLSQGQRQLISIARAVISKRELLILDEATSNVDTRTEQRIQEAMDNLSYGKTSFVIAHRLSTIQNADLILVIDKGDIVEQGTHEELLEMKGFYASLYDAQFEDCN